LKKKWQKRLRSVKKCFDIIVEDHLGAYAAQAAFFAVLSIFPFLMLCLSLVKFTPVTQAQVVELIQQNMPQYLTGFLLSIVRQVYSANISIMTFSIVTVLWAASRGFRSMCNGLDSVHGVLSERNIWLAYAKALVYTIVLSMMLVICIVIMVLGPTIQALLEQYVPALSMATDVYFSFRAIILIVLLGLLFTMLYKLLPAKKISFKSQLPGGFLCAIAWIVFSHLLSVYVEQFNGFSMYGSLTTIALVMFWLYCCYYILLLCAEINVFLSAETIREKIRNRSRELYARTKKQVRKDRTKQEN